MESGEPRTTSEEVRGDPRRFGAFVAQWRDRLRRMVELRMDPALRSRLDASDVVQEACAEAVERLPAWLAQTELPLHLWLRFIAGQKLLQLHRQHLGAAIRDVRREVAFSAGGEGGAPEASADTLVNAIAESGVLSPSGVAIRSERLDRLRAAIDAMKPEDREVILLRHFEQLGNDDVAHLLGITKGGASLRFMRATTRLREIVRDVSEADGPGR